MDGNKAEASRPKNEVFYKFLENFPPKNIHSSEIFKIIFVQVIIWTVKWHLSTKIYHFSVFKS